MKSKIDVDVSLPKVCVFPPVDSWEDARDVVSKMLPVVTELAESAFGKNDRTAWENVQSALYVWNTDELERRSSQTDYNSLVRRALRNAIVEVESKYIANHSLDCQVNFTVEKAVTELKEKALAHRINKHPLLKYMENNGLSKDVVAKFIENYYVNNRLYHLHLAVLTANVPLNHRVDIAKNFYDEMGAENGLPMAHPVLFLKNFDHIGFPGKFKPLPESLFMLNTKIRNIMLSSDYRYGLGGLGFIEIAMPEQMVSILNGLKKSAMAKEDLIFWDLHISIDLVHGETWFEEMREIIHTAEDAAKVLNGGMALLDARAAFYDGVWEFAQSIRQVA